jgi:5-methylcytosine-specific restriction enzyme subunit McrC
VEPQYRGFLDEDGLVPMRPDVVWLDERNAPRAVIDAKYKAEWHSGFPNSDVYQALAYATALELPEAHLVYAKGEDPVTSHMIRGTHVVVHAHALDLALPPDALLVGVQSLASRIADQSRSLATVA